MAIRDDIEAAVEALLPTLADEYIPETEANANGHDYMYQKNLITQRGMSCWYLIVRYTSNADYIRCYPGPAGLSGPEGPAGEWATV